MNLSAEERDEIRKLGDAAWPPTAAQILEYANEVGAPPRFVLYIFDPEGAGESGVAMDFEARAFAHYTLDANNEGLDQYETNARRKAALSLRTGKDSGVVVNYFPELLQEYDFPRPGCVIGTLNGKKIAFTSSGLRGDEDAAFGTLFLSRIVRAAAESG